MPTFYVFNSRSLAKNDALEHLYIELKENNVDIAIITETWFTQIHADETFTLNGYNLIRKDRINRKGGGVALYIKQLFTYDQIFIEEYREFEVIWIRMKINRENIYVAAIYHPPKMFNYLESDLLETISNTIETIKSQVNHSHIFICGDTNSLETNEIEINTGLKQIIDSATRGTNILDVIITNAKHLYKKPQIFKSIGLSDHNAIVFKPKYLQTTPNRKKLVTFRDIRDHHKILFTQKLRDLDWSSFYEYSNSNTLAIKFTATITKLFENSFPIRKVFLKDRDPWWMTPIIKYWLERKKMARRRNQSELLDRISVRIRKLIEESKKKYFNVCINDCKRGSKKWWSRVKTVSRMMPIPTNDSNNYITSNSLNDFFQSISIDNNYEPPARIPTCNNLQVETESVRKQLYCIKKTSAGPSGIPYWVYKENGNWLASPITHIINCCLNTGCFPDLLKRELITPLPKTKNPISPKDFRPVAVTDVLARVIEKIILSFYVDDVNHLNKNEQHGFSRNGSTSTALISLHYKIDEILKTHDYARILITDLSKAFNKIRHSSCIQSLIEKNIHPAIVNLVGSFLTNRQQSTKFKNEMSSWRQTNRGIGQGTVQGPILFVSTFDMVTLACESVRYVDDLNMVLNPHEDPNKHIDEMEEQSKEIGLELNSDKTFQMIVRKRSNLRIINENEGIARVNEMKYLGIYITDKFSMKTQCKRILANANKTMFLLHRLKLMGMNSKNLSLLFQSLIISKVCYGIEFWWPLLNKKEKDIIQKIPGKAFRKNIIENETKIETLALTRMRNLLDKVKANDSHILRQYMPPIVPQGRRAGNLTVRYVSTSREQKLFFNFLSLL